MAGSASYYLENAVSWRFHPLPQLERWQMSITGITFVAAIYLQISKPENLSGLFDVVILPTIYLKNIINDACKR